MKTLIIIETAEELLAFANRHRVKQPGHKDDVPLLPQESTILLDDDCSALRLEAEGFQLSPAVKPEHVLRLLFEHAGFKIRILNTPAI